MFHISRDDLYLHVDIQVNVLTPPYRYFYATHATRALQSHDLSGEGIKLWITYILF